MKHNWWNEEIAFYIEKRGLDPEEARIVTILRWTYYGDFRPLAEAIRVGRVPEEVLNLLYDMIVDGRLKVVHRKYRGRPRSPEAQARKFGIASVYGEARLSGSSSKEAFEQIAEALGMSEQTLRQAVTAWRKAQRKIKSA
jgi:ABC-type Fe3+-hydroxamate transport system substrate-binding protein